MENEVMINNKIVIGPVYSNVTPNRYSGGVLGSGVYENAVACNCMGPQPGQTKCPCKLRAEIELGRKMVEDGVTINGKRYRLVPE
jgi:hypothetical protein